MAHRLVFSARAILPISASSRASTSGMSSSFSSTNVVPSAVGCPHSMRVMRRKEGKTCLMRARMFFSGSWSMTSIPKVKMPTLTWATSFPWRWNSR